MLGLSPSISFREVLGVFFALVPYFETIGLHFHC